MRCSSDTCFLWCRGGDFDQCTKSQWVFWGCWKWGWHVHNSYGNHICGARSRLWERQRNWIFFTRLQPLHRWNPERSISFETNLRRQWEVRSWSWSACYNVFIHTEYLDLRGMMSSCWSWWYLMIGLTTFITEMQYARIDSNQLLNFEWFPWNQN